MSIKPGNRENEIETTPAKGKSKIICKSWGIGSSFDGIELIRKINFEYGNNVVIGIISSSNEPEEQAKAIQSGAQFWIIKSDEIEPRLEEFRKDYEGYKNRTAPFKIYK